MNFIKLLIIPLTLSVGAVTLRCSKSYWVLRNNP